MIVAFEAVSLVRNRKYILKDIDWEISAGEHWALLGLNGAGKTMLLNMLNGYVFPTKGKLRVLGKTLGQYDMRELRKTIGLVSSSLQEKLYGRSVAMDIVMSGKFATMDLFDDISTDDRDFASLCLERLNALSLAKREYRTLSHGERQRVLIARALMAKPSLLILDEPCNGLDIIAREQLLDLILGLCEDVNAPTLIYVTHHTEEILPNFSRTLLLRKGEIFSAGVSEDVLTRENLSAFFQVPIVYEKSGDRVILHLDYGK